jgi:Ulp1 family protease
MLRKQGTDVVTGVIHYIAGVANINENHWVSYILDGGSGTILVGDSLLDGREATLERGERATIINSLRWWIHQSWGLVAQTPRPIPSSPLFVQRQQDFSSCGIYVFNSIATFFKPKAHPWLALSSLRSTRAKFFNGIVEHHHSMQVFSAKFPRTTGIQNTKFTLGFRFT